MFLKACLINLARGKIQEKLNFHSSRETFRTSLLLIAINLASCIVLLKCMENIPHKTFYYASWSSQVQAYNLGCKVFHLILQLKALPFIMASTKAIN